MPATLETEMIDAEMVTAAVWTDEEMDAHAEYIVAAVVAGEADGFKVYGVPFINSEPMVEA